MTLSRRVTLSQPRCADFPRLVVELSRHAGPQEKFAARTEPENLAVGAIRLARVTAAASVPDQPVTPVRPVLARDELHQIALNLFGMFLFR